MEKKEKLHRYARIRHNQRKRGGEYGETEEGDSIGPAFTDNEEGKEVVTEETGIDEWKGNNKNTLISGHM